MEFDVGAVVKALPRLLEGAQVTLEVSLLAMLLGIMVGVVLVIAMQPGRRVVHAIARAHISFARGTPLLIQILIVFFVLPAVGLDIPRFWAAVIALSLNSGAYIAEMIRGGLTAIPKGHFEAARALSMPRSLIWRHITLPQVFSLILPPLTIEFTALVKGSALVSVIGVIEMTRTAQQIIASTYQPVEIWVTVGTLYFVVCFALGALTRRLERVTSVYRAY